MGEERIQSELGETMNENEDRERGVRGESKRVTPVCEESVARTCKMADSQKTPYRHPAY